MKSWISSKVPQRSSRVPLIILSLILLLFTLACTLLRPTARSISGQVVGLTRLPTFTRTPLPPFTPTPTVTPPLVVVAAVTDTPVTVSESLTSPTLYAPQPTVGIAPSPVLETVSPAVASLPPTPVDTPTPLPDLLSPEPPADTASIASQPIVATVTGTPSPTIIPTPMPTDTPLPTATPSATATEKPPPTDTPIPLPAGWVFNGVRSVSISGGRYLMVAGILFNNTGVTQTLSEIKRIFPGAPELASASNYRSYYPVPQVSQGGWIPFKLLIPDSDIAGDFELEAVGNEGGDGPRQQFEFLDVNAVTEKERYCVAGKVRNNGGQLNAYLVVAVVLYDSEDKVINYNDYEAESPQAVSDDQQKVNICVDSLGQEVARYELQAWGL